MTTVGTAVLANSTAQLGKLVLARTTGLTPLPPFPQVVIRLSLTRPNDPPVWQPITEYAYAFTISRGRQSELGQTETGTASTLLNNRDRRFDPMNTDSPYYPDLKLRRGLQISAFWRSREMMLFTGFLEAVPPEWPGGMEGTVILHAADAFKWFNQHDVSATFSEELSNLRAFNIVSQVSGRLAASGEFPLGASRVQGVTLVRVPALAHLHDTLASEGGRHFMAGDGHYVFRDRHHNLRETGMTVLGTFGDEEPDQRYIGVRMTNDDSWLYNWITVSRDGGTPQLAIHNDSWIEYDKLSKDIPAPLLISDSEALAAAKYHAGRLGVPQQRIVSLDLSAFSDQSVVQHILERDIGHIVRVRRHPPGGGPVIERDVAIEHIQHKVSVPQGGNGQPSWITTWALAPSEVLVNAARYDDATAQFDVSVFSW